MRHTVTFTQSGHLTRDGARVLRDALRKSGRPQGAESITRALSVERARTIASLRGIDVTFVAAVEATPAQRAVATRSRNTRKARKANSAPTGFMRAYLSARKDDPTLTREAFAVVWAQDNALVYA